MYADTRLDAGNKKKNLLVKSSPRNTPAVSKIKISSCFMGITIFQIFRNF